MQPGDVVTKGQRLAEIDSPEVARLGYELRRLDAENERLLAEVTRAQSQVDSLEIEVPALAGSAELAEAEVQRLSGGGESVAANLLAQRKAESLKLRAEAGLRGVSLTQARAEVESLKRQAEATRLSATALRGTLPGFGGAAPSEALADPASPGLVQFSSPIDGVVISRDGVPGRGVGAGAPILTIGNLSRVQVEGELPEGLLDRVGAVQQALVRVRRGVSPRGSVSAVGTVRFISPVIDATKRTAHLIVDVDNSAGLFRQGEFVDLAVVLGTNESAVVAPAGAIVKEGPLQYVFVKEGKGENTVFRKRDVATGVRDDRIVEIKQGLVPGDEIVVSGAFSVSQLRGFVPGAPEPAAQEAEDGHGHAH